MTWYGMNPDRNRKFLLQQVGLSISIFEDRIKEAFQGGAKGAYDNVAVPSAEVLDRLLRAETATERALNRAIDRLECLQRRRKGEDVPPQVTVRLTR
jgi:hypothetical protein